MCCFFFLFFCFALPASSGAFFANVQSADWTKPDRKMEIMMRPRLSKEHGKQQNRDNNNNSTTGQQQQQRQQPVDKLWRVSLFFWVPEELGEFFEGERARERELARVAAGGRVGSPEQPITNYK